MTKKIIIHDQATGKSKEYKHSAGKAALLFAEKGGVLAPGQNIENGEAHQTGTGYAVQVVTIENGEKEPAE